MSRRNKVHAIVVAILVVGALIHQIGPRIVYTSGGSLDVQWRLWEWYIEDAAISFNYARNLAAGDGLVTNPGGERVEGYSNPLWVFLMAGWYLVGVDGFLSSKIMALIFGSCTIVLSYAIARELIPGRTSHAPLMAPFALAASAQFAFWNASGLENSLFCLLLAAGIWRTLVEARTGGFPWAAMCYFLLAITRPEAIMYGALGGFWAMFMSLSRGRGIKPTLWWLVVFFVPFLTYHAIRYNYFAWLFPNTYYAKLGHRNFRPFSWNMRGWKYLREYSHQLWVAYYIPLFVAGVIGLYGARKIATALVVVIASAVLVYPGPETWIDAGIWWQGLEVPNHWIEIRVWTLLALAIVVPFLGMGAGNWMGRALVWGTGCIVIFFCLKAVGDWMKGFRWMSFLAVPLSVVFALGVHEIAGLAQRMFGSARDGGAQWGVPGWLVASVASVLLIPPNMDHSAWFLGVRETGPFAVKKRVDYTAWVSERLFLERARNLDVDQGAHTYWSKHEMLDIAGLVDVSMAHHNFQRPFIQEYLFEEMKPEFAHVHGGWASSSRIPTHAEWKRDYVEIPGYPTGKRSVHTGNHIRRDLMFTKRWTGPTSEVSFDGGVVLKGFDVPSPEVSEGKSFFIEVAFQYKKATGKEDFRVLGFLSNDAGLLTVFDLPMGYDWVRPEDWKTGEIFFGKFSPMLPKTLVPGWYELGFVVLSENGTVLEAVSPSEEGSLPIALPEGAVIGGRDGVPARVARGEVRFREGVKIGVRGTGEKQAHKDLDKAIELAGTGDCERAADFWLKARRHIPKAEQWYATNESDFSSAIAACFIERAQYAEERELAVTSVEAARGWDHRAPELWEIADGLSDALYSEGMAAYEAREWETAYALLSDAVRAKPGNSWAKRYAESARDYRLEIDPETKARQEEERQLRLEKLQEKREREAESREQKADEDASSKDGDLNNPKTKSGSVEKSDPRRREKKPGRAVPVRTLEAERAAAEEPEDDVEAEH